MNEAEILIEIYERLKVLRGSGMKMKDIAQAIDWSPSVLSAFYAAVLPSFSELYQKENNFNKALEEALLNVNNLSKRKVLENLIRLHQIIKELKPIKNKIENHQHPFIMSLWNESKISTEKSHNLEGIYMSYSCSSSIQTLKAEPFYISNSSNHTCLTVGRKSVHGFIREGIGMLKEQQMLYLLLNEFDFPNMSLVTIYLQLPFLEEFKLLKGLYLVPDYNKNPIARRIIFLKLKDYYNPEEFKMLDAKLIMPENFSDVEKIIFDYTCNNSDSLKMCTLPSPKLDFRDLIAEKKLLAKEKELEII